MSTGHLCKALHIPLIVVSRHPGFKPTTLRAATSALSQKAERSRGYAHHQAFARLPAYQNGSAHQAQRVDGHKLYLVLCVWLAKIGDDTGNSPTQGARTAGWKPALRLVHDSEKGTRDGRD